VLGELGTLLPRLTRAPWLVSRRVRSDYYLEPKVRAALERRYERVLWCEEPEPRLAGLEARQERIPPICCRQPEECLGRPEARAALGVDPEQPLVIVLGSGSAAVQDDLLRLLLRVRDRIRDGFRLEVMSTVLPAGERTGLRVRALYPAMRYLRAADLVVSAAGYSAVWESRSLGLPAIWLPQARRYDDQAWRARGGLTAATPRQLEETIASSLRTRCAAQARPEPFCGATVLAERLAGRLGAATPAPRRRT
jgi:UDP:flavonoid glycosyltransferase YjiC (YdhE family)